VNLPADRKDEGAVGNAVVLKSHGPNVSFKFYSVDRAGHTPRLRAAEIALDMSITLAQPARAIWPVFKDFNLWMNRFGYLWDGVPADSEDGFVSLRNRAGANELKWQEGSRVQYVVRKVVPERLIYFDSQPTPIAGKDGVWTGHNLMSLYEEGGNTKIVIFMEHTWYSETMSIEELRAEAKTVLDGGVLFWRDYFIPDLISAVDSASPAG
jgi:hypothetical protein